MPDIMARAGASSSRSAPPTAPTCKDYARRDRRRRPALILKVHTSNYRDRRLHQRSARRASSRRSRTSTACRWSTISAPARWSISRASASPHEPTVAEAVGDGADLVTFSGDKLLGGPQAGFIVGRKDLIARINRNPMKRALRLDKIRLAALEATLSSIAIPTGWPSGCRRSACLPAPQQEIEALAAELAPAGRASAVGAGFAVRPVACASQIGSGALPLETIPSAGLGIGAARPRAASGRALEALAAALRRLPVPVIGRIADGALILDLRCLEDESGFRRNLAADWRRPMQLA